MSGIRKEESSLDTFLLRELAIRWWLQDVLLEDLTTKNTTPNRTPPAPQRTTATTPPSAKKTSNNKHNNDEENEGPFGDVPLPDLLTDGVRLCKLMLAIVPRSIPIIHKGKDIHRLAFKKRANISFFLAACEECGIPFNERYSCAPPTTILLLASLPLSFAGHTTATVSPPPQHNN